MKNNKTIFAFFISLFSVFLLVSCSKNEFVGRWTGSESYISWRVEISKDGSFFMEQRNSRKNEVITSKGKWIMNDNKTILEMPLNEITVSHNKNGLYQLDANAETYNYSGTYYLRKDGAFSDSRNGLDEDQFYLVKQKN